MCVCMYVCASVCVCVCGSAAAQTVRSILMNFFTNDLTDICEVHFSQILKIRNDDVMVAILLAFLLRHSHGRNFAPIFFKISV